MAPKGERLTRQDIKMIEDEINERKLVKRPAILKALKEAAAMGDRSENFEYYVAKRENGINNGRIHYLENKLRYAILVDDASDDDVAGMNNTVIVHFEDDPDDALSTFRIVTSIRSDSRKGLISIESPLGKALMGHRVGDSVEVFLEDGTSYFATIKQLLNTGEAVTDRLQQY